jgi:cytochrome c551/c552
MKKLIVLSMLTFIVGSIASCGSSQSSDSSTAGQPAEVPVSKEENGNPSYDPHRGEGKFTSVELGASLDAGKAAGGESIYQVKCSGCHKLTDEKLVGPGWSGVTKRHEPAWIMNFITNTDVMIDKDPAVQAQLELCLVRMPNQNLSDDDARNLLEFMRKNDGVK